MKLRMRLNLNLSLLPLREPRKPFLRPVERLVLGGGAFPGVVARHRALLGRAPGAFVAPERQGAIERLKEPLGRLLLEAEPPPLRAFADAVREPPDGADQRKRSIAQRVELVEPAGLEPRGHDEHVGAGLDPVRKAIVEAELRRHPAEMLQGKAP